MNFAFATVRLSRFSLVELAFFTAIASLSACGNNPETSSQAETVYISVYHPWSPSYILKTVGDLALLDNGESIQIESTKWAAVMKQTAIPIPDSRIARTTKVWDKKLVEVPAPGGIAAILDRKSGVICVENTCARAYAICPPWEDMRLGKKCLTFAVE